MNRKVYHLTKLKLCIVLTILNFKVQAQVAQPLKFGNLNPVIEINELFTNGNQDPNKVDIDSGKYFLEKGDLNTALKYFKSYVTSYPRDAVGFYFAGVGFYYLGRYDSALHYINTSLLKNPLQPTATFYKGLIYSHNGQKEEAINQFKILEDLKDYSYLGNYGRALISIKDWNFEDAKRWLNASIKENPEYIPALLTTGILSIELAEWKLYGGVSVNSGLDYINRVLVLDSTNQSAKYLKMRILCDYQDQCESAIALANGFLDGNQYLGRILYYMIKREYRNENFSFAKEIMSRKMTPHDPKFHLITKLTTYIENREQSVKGSCYQLCPSSSSNSTFKPPFPGVLTWPEALTCIRSPQGKHMRRQSEG